MKKLLIVVAVFLACAACNDKGWSDRGLEYLTQPVISNITYTPESPADREYVTVKALVTCPYGIKKIYILCQIEGEETRMTVGERDFSGNPPESVNYEAKIPGQRAGVIMKFLISTRSAYGVVQTSEVKEYVVSK